MFCMVMWVEVTCYVNLLVSALMIDAHIILPF